MNPDPLPPPSPDLGLALVGSWGLVSREDYDREGRRIIDPILGADPLGMTNFAPGHFTLEGSVAPANVGLTLTRDVRVIGDRLLIRLPTTAIDGTPITRTLTFERLG